MVEFVDGLSELEYNARFRLRSPVLFTPPPSSGDAVADEDLFKWSTRSLRQNYGELPVRTAVRDRAGKNSARVKHAGATLERYLRRGSRAAATSSEEDGDDDDGDDDEYLFDPHFLEQTPELVQTLRVPGFLPFPPRPEDFFFLAAGPPGSGTGFHRHAPAWNLLISGEKRWWLAHPKYKAPPDGHLEGLLADSSQRRVLERFGDDGESPSSQQCIITCVQRSGMFLAIPPGWWHATVNTRECVGVAHVLPFSGEYLTPKGWIYPPDEEGEANVEVEVEVEAEVGDGSRAL